MSLAIAEEAARGASRPSGPYVGLVPYDVDDAAFFFGRSTEVGIVVANLRSAPLTILYGPSGVGKSSLLNAGVVHDLCETRRAAGAESPFAVCVFKSWREEPIDGLREAARDVLQELAGEDQLPPRKATLAETLRTWTASSGTLLVILDQFEEYFQYHSDESEDERLTGFAAELARIVNDPSMAVHILLSIREDAWAKLDFFEGHIPSLFANYVRVDHLDLASAREAIEGPIEAWNRSLSEGEPRFEIELALVEAVLDATAGEGLPLTGARESAAGASPRDRVQAPYLQLVLERLWRDTTAHGARTLTVARLEALGGAKKIVENHLRDALDRLPSEDQDVAADCFRFLVSPSKTKIAYPVGDLAQLLPRPRPVDEVAAVLDMLCSAESGRILRAIPPADDGGSTSYELYHDILAEPILDWRKEYEQRREQEAEEERQRAARRRRRRLIAVLALGLLVPVFAALATFALLSRENAKDAERDATSLALAFPAGEQLTEGRVDTALLLGLEAYRARPIAQATGTLISALEQVRSSRVAAILHGVQGSLSVAAFDSDGGTLATVGEDGTVQLWDVAGQTEVGAPLNVVDDPMTVAGVAARVAGVALRDERTLAVANSDGEVQLWDVDRRSARGPPQRVGLVESIAFSSDGRTLATIGSDERVQLWDVATTPYQKIGQPVAGTNGAPATGVAVSSNRVIAVADSGGKVQLWDVGTNPYEKLGQPLAVPSVTAVALSSDGRTLAVTGSGGKVQLWDVATRPYEQLDKPVASVDGASFTGIAVSSDGMLAVADSGGKVQLWKGEPLVRPPGTELALRPDGRTLAAIRDDGKVQLWDLGTTPYEKLGKPVAGNNEASATGVALSSDGKLAVAVAVADGDGKVQLWAVGTRPYRKIGPAIAVGSVTAVALSPNGRTLAVADSGGTVQLWDVAARPYEKLGQPLAAPYLSAVAFSPDGRRLALADIGGQVQLWKTSTRERVGEPLSLDVDYPDERVNGVAFSPDNRTLVVAVDGLEPTLRFLDIEARTEIARLSSTKSVNGVAVSADGTVASGGFGGGISLWNGVLWKDKDALEDRVCGLVWGALGEEEWEDLTGLGYRASCN
jgi:WD40 repeat protein